MHVQVSLSALPACSDMTQLATTEGKDACRIASLNIEACNAVAKIGAKPNCADLRFYPSSQGGKEGSDLASTGSWPQPFQGLQGLTGVRSVAFPSFSQSQSGQQVCKQEVWAQRPMCSQCLLLGMQASCIVEARRLRQSFCNILLKLNLTMQICTIRFCAYLGNSIACFPGLYTACPAAKQQL